MPQRPLVPPASGLWDSFLDHGPCVSCGRILLFLIALSEEPVCRALERGVRLETAFLSVDSALATAWCLVGTHQVQLILII